MYLLGWNSLLFYGGIIMSMFRILHLSDVHIGNTHCNSQDIAHKISSDLEHSRMLPIECVVVTGDIFEGGLLNKSPDKALSLISEAVLFFITILNQLNVFQEGRHVLTIEDFIFVPGNHDICRTDNDEDRYKNFYMFLNKFYDAIPAWYNKDNRTVLKVYPNAKLYFAGFNSCEFEKSIRTNKDVIKKIKKINEEKLRLKGIDKKTLISILEEEAATDYEDYGYISLSQINSIKAKVRDFSDYNAIALFHHHFYLFPEISEKYGDTSLIKNHAVILPQLKQLNIRTVLHGHKHFDLERPIITDDYYDSTDSIIDVFSGGSVGTNEVPRHTFNVIDIYGAKEDIKLSQSKFVYNGETLAPIVRKLIPPKNIYTQTIRLLEFFQTVSPDLYNDYIKYSEKMNITYKTCNEIVKWVSNVFTGFTSLHKALEVNPNNIFFLLFAINYRVLAYQMLMSDCKEQFEPHFLVLKEMFSACIEKTDVRFDIDAYFEIFNCERLVAVKNKCDSLLGDTPDRNTRDYLAFSMIGVFFTDLNLVLTQYADNFYKKTIRYKVNIKLDDNKFHQEVPAPRIFIKSDADHRSIYVEMRCNEATAHKLAVLFVKEFELIINKYEDYFKLVGLKLYHISPIIDKDNAENTLDNYNFEAYIPTLLPLLTGDNIYTTKEVFARELIQNSIDAIAVREAKDIGVVFDKTIFIDINESQNDKKTFTIRDFGTGMDSFKIERYFTSIGRSFYSGDEYQELEISYKPISNFGIGFLSSFMVCKEIDVRTKSYMPGSEGLYLHIPNYEGCFFVEKENTINVGTEIVLHLNKDISGNRIVDYIKSVMKDIQYDICISHTIIGKDKKEHKKTDKIVAYSMKKDKKESVKFFIPSIQDGESPHLSWVNDVSSDEYINKYKHGILISLDSVNKSLNSSKRQPSSSKNKKMFVLNSGIMLNQTSVNDIIMSEYPDIEQGDYPSFDICINLPSNLFTIDVAREKAALNVKRIGIEYFIRNILLGLSSQIAEFVDLCKKTEYMIPAIAFQRLVRYILNNQAFRLSNDSFKEFQLHMDLFIENDTITVKLSRNTFKKSGAFRFPLYMHEKDAVSEMESFARNINVFMENINVDINTIRSLDGAPIIDMFMHEIGRYPFGADYVNNVPMRESQHVLDKLLQVSSMKIVPNVETAAEFVLMIFTILSTLSKGIKKKNHYEDIAKVQLRILSTLFNTLLSKHTMHEVENNKAEYSISSEQIKSLIQMNDH